jgi:hypothetical protein
MPDEEMSTPLEERVARLEEQVRELIMALETQRRPGEADLEFLHRMREHPDNQELIPYAELRKKAWLP